MTIRGMLQRTGVFWSIILALVVILGSDVALAKKTKPESGPPAVEKTEYGKAMTFTVLRLSSTQCEPLCPEWIAADGELTDQTPAKLTKLLANPAYRKLPIVLNSPGGKIDSALAMGRLIRKYDMNTAVAPSSVLDCPFLQSFTNTCPQDANVHLGTTSNFGGYCDSACTLMLLGGRVRVVNHSASLGVHQPHGESQRWVDHYWDTWRMVNGKKVIVSHRFVKRTYEKPKTFVGVTAYSKPTYMKYLKDMGASAQILDEMAKASPANLNEIRYVPGDAPRQKLGFVTDNELDISSYVSADHCKTFGKLSVNCVLIKDYVSKTPTPSATPCFILSGCGGAKKQDQAVKGVPCFVSSGCSDADRIATQEWLMKKQQAATATPCFIESGCSKTDKSVTQDTIRNGETEMSFRLMRLYSNKCEPRCPEWIAAEGWITKDTAKEFEAFMSKPQARNLPVFLQSHGGDFNAAMEMGRIIDKNNLDTAVASSSILGCPSEKTMRPCDGNGGAASSGYANSAAAYCERACVAMLLAGTTRVVDLDARVGVDMLSEENRVPFEEYLITLSQSFGIVKAMDLARSAGGFNNISDMGSRRDAGLFSTFGNNNLNSLIGDDHCNAMGQIAANCVDVSKQEGQASKQTAAVHTK